jgi:hypothetical protein
MPRLRADVTVTDRTPQATAFPCFAVWARRALEQLWSFYGMADYGKAESACRWTRNRGLAACSGTNAGKPRGRGLLVGAGPGTSRTRLGPARLEGGRKTLENDSESR